VAVLCYDAVVVVIAVCL